MSEKLSATQVKVLECFRDEQLTEPWDDVGTQYTLRDECAVMGYVALGRETNLSRTQLRRALLDMKRRGLIELTPAVNHDYVPSGSGYVLTETGVALINRIMPWEPEATQEKLAI